ncbi:MAG: hypothetical protein J0L69_15590 [Bacteroidetes bacterium]|nr:hypothetical protein [Bacteroidota bacterium]
MTLLIYGIVKIRSIRKTYAEFALQRNDFVWSLTQTFQKLFGNSIATSIIQSEVQSLRYSLFFWKIRDEVTPGDVTFTGYKNNSYKVVMGVIGFVMLIELFSVHLLLWRFGMIVVVIAFILSAYGILFLLGDFIAIIRRPLSITESNTFYLRVGLRWNAEINISNVDSIVKESSKTEKIKVGGLNCVLVGNPDCILILKEPVVVTGYYGIKKVTNKILLSVDEPDSFIAEINNRIASESGK